MNLVLIHSDKMLFQNIILLLVHRINKDMVIGLRKSGLDLTLQRSKVTKYTDLDLIEFVDIVEQQGIDIIYPTHSFLGHQL